MELLMFTSYPFVDTVQKVSRSLVLFIVKMSQEECPRLTRPTLQSVILSTCLQWKLLFLPLTEGGIRGYWLYDTIM